MAIFLPQNMHRISLIPIGSSSGFKGEIEAGLKALPEEAEY
jgi:hypothetical protein